MVRKCQPEGLPQIASALFQMADQIDSPNAADKENDSRITLGAFYGLIGQRTVGLQNQRNGFSQVLPGLFQRVALGIGATIALAVRVGVCLPPGIHGQTQSGRVRESARVVRVNDDLLDERLAQVQIGADRTVGPRRSPQLGVAGVV